MQAKRKERKKKRPTISLQYIKLGNNSNNKNHTAKAYSISSLSSLLQALFPVYE
jgi:hypothetical protein